MRDFFEKIFPSNGFYCIAEPVKTPEYSFFRHYVCETIEQTARTAESLDAKGKDVYFAVGTLNEKEKWNPEKINKKTGEKGAPEVRVHSNMLEHKAFILDIDCGEGKDYQSKPEAIEALKKFVKTVGLPKPILVDSGGGIHVYWPLDKAIPSKVWGQVATQFKSLTNTLGLKADNSRTSDLSSILRVPGTHNHKKDDARPVKILSDAESTSTITLINIIKNACKEYGVKEEKPKETTPNIFAQFGDNLNKKADGEKVCRKCKQMKYCLDAGGNVPEPLWKGSLQLARFFESTPTIHDLSNGHPQYSYESTEAKQAVHIEKNIGPTLCKTLEQASDQPELCDGCKLHGKDKSPIGLGYDYNEELPPPVLNTSVVVPETSTKPKIVLEDEGIDNIEDVVENATNEAFSGIPNPPYPYSRTAKGIYIVSDSDGGELENACLYEYDIFPSEVVEDKATGNWEVIISLQRAFREAYSHIQIPMQLFGDSRAFTKFMMSKGVAVHPQHQSTFQTYMISYLKQIQSSIKETNNYAQFGWHENGTEFVTRDFVFTESGEKTCRISERIKSSGEVFKKKGTLEEWKKVIDIYAAPGYEHYAFGHLAGYGSLLFEFQPYMGAIINMVGDGGSGKTTVLKTINTLFGDPVSALMKQDDKQLARMSRIATFKSICATYDEITNIDPFELSDFCYAITQGRDRLRLNSDASEKSNNLSWKLILIASSNSSLSGKLSTIKQDSSAEALRVFEYYVYSHNNMSLQDANRLIDRPLENNYGHAGEIFVNYVLQNREKVEQKLSEITDKIIGLAGIETRERYWAAVAGACITGGLIAKELGLHSFDMNLILNWTVNQIQQMRGTVKENKKDARVSLVEFINQNIRNTIIIGGGQEKSKPVYVIEEAKGELLIRNEIDTNQIYIDRAAFRKWVVTNGGDYNFIKKDLFDRKILLNEDANKVLSSGSNTTRSGQTKCWLIDTAHKEMAGAVLKPVLVVDNDVKVSIEGV